MGVALFPGYGEKLGGAGGRSDLNSASSIIRSKHWCYTASNRISPQDNKKAPLFIIFIFFLKNNTNKIKWKKASENNYNATGSPFWYSKKRNTFTQKKVYIYIHLNGYGQKSSLGRPLMERTTRQPARTQPNISKLNSGRSWDSVKSRYSFFSFDRWNGTFIKEEAGRGSI